MNENRERGKNIVIIILFFMLIVAIVFMGIYKFRSEQPVRTAVLEALSPDEMSLNEDGMVDVNINQYVHVIHGVMQDLQFKNVNANRLLQCKIMQDDKCIYDSGQLEPGNVIIGDFVETKKLELGENDVVAEVTSYSLDGVKRMQLNIEMKLLFES